MLSFSQLPPSGLPVAKVSLCVVQRLLAVPLAVLQLLVAVAQLVALRLQILQLERLVAVGKVLAFQFCCK